MKIISTKLPNYPSQEMPKTATSGSAGIDLVAAIFAEKLDIPAGEISIIPCGIKVALPKGAVGFVCPRSGLAAKFGITVLNAPGIIDEDYRGEIKVILVNQGDKEYVVKKGDRIAQLLILNYNKIEFEEITNSTFDVLSTERGEGGLGHTGK
jgi:dUTP pyrophosphatase